MIEGKRVLLIVGGGIAAYKSLELVRRLRERGAAVRVVMTTAAQRFVTPLSFGALTADRVYTDLWDRDDEHDVGHIRLAREADAIVMAPATAHRIACLAHGLADDLAGTVLLAARVPVLLAPAMNPAMWSHAATRRNVDILAGDGISMVGPETGEMAESGEEGVGRMAEPPAIVAALEALLRPATARLDGMRAVVTSGPTHEPIDPVRYVANRSSGRQGHAIAGALARQGAEVVLVSGPVSLPPPSGVQVVLIETAQEMLTAVEAALPADIAVMAAAVADWRTTRMAGGKIKKDGDGPPMLELVENPDILARLSHGARRPRLVVGFAAETENVIDNARDKRLRKGCDWIVANDVSPATGVMGGHRNQVHIVTADGVESWPDMDKEAVAERLVERIATTLDERREAAE